MKMTKMLCCGVLGCAAMLSATVAKAATDDDKKFLAMASQSDVNEIKLSELAEQKGSSPIVKSFATKMVKDHKMLTASMKPFAEAWGLTPPTGPDADHQKVWDKLNGLSGADFDKEYMSAMREDHTKAFSAFEKESKDTKDLKFKAAVIKGKSVVAAHKNMAFDAKHTM